MLYDRVSYSNIRDTIDDKDISDVGMIILREIDSFYSTDESAKCVDKDILQGRLARKYPQQEEMFTTALNGLKEVSTPNVLADYVDVRLHALGQRIASALSSGKNNASTMELIEEYTFLKEKGEKVFDTDEDGVYIGMEVDDLFDELDPSNLINVYPKSLNDHLDGGVPRGTHIVVFARPETGKSMFMINMCSECLQQGLKVLYLGNEDPAATMRQRILSNMTGLPRADILRYIDDVKAEAGDKGYNNLIFVERSPGTVSEVRRLVMRYKPDVFIVDQIRNLNTSKSLSKVEALEYVAQSMRNLGKEAQALAVSVTQAGNSGDGKLILDMGDVDYSNTGIPSTADLMIGIGINREYEAAKKRMISLPKNKISGKHEVFPVSVVTELSKVEDV